MGMKTNLNVANSTYFEFHIEIEQQRRIAQTNIENRWKNNRNGEVDDPTGNIWLIAYTHHSKGIPSLASSDAQTKIRSNAMAKNVFIFYYTMPFHISVDKGESRHIERCVLFILFFFSLQARASVCVWRVSVCVTITCAHRGRGKGMQNIISSYIRVDKWHSKSEKDVVNDVHWKVIYYACRIEQFYLKIAFDSQSKCAGKKIWPLNLIWIDSYRT